MVAQLVRDGKPFATLGGDMKWAAADPAADPAVAEHLNRCFDPAWVNEPGEHHQGWGSTAAVKALEFFRTLGPCGIEWGGRDELPEGAID